MATPLTLNLYVNGKQKTVSVDDDTEPLLYVLRNQVGTQGVKFGCGVAQCGALHRDPQRCHDQILHYETQHRRSWIAGHHP
jgi:aerobic-type carbon monoxide dehydrogenase small subunit (CoxS/CutS family)